LIDGSSTDNDSFSATVLGSGWDAANTTLVNIETLNLTYSVADNGFNATNMAVSTNTFNILGTAATGTITTANGKTFGLGTDYRATASVTDDTPTLNLAGNSGTTAATSPTFDTDAGTTSLTINVNGTTGLNLDGDELVATNAITVKGASNLTVYATAAQLNAAKITATSPNYTGSLTLVPSDSGALDFSDVTSPSTGVRRVNIPAAYNNTITLNENNTGSFTVGVAATSTAAWAVAQAGSGQSDTVTVSFGSAATGSGAITATSIESLTLAGGTASTGTLTLGAVTLTNGAGTQTVTITNAGNVAFTSAGAQATIAADTVTATGVAGTLGASGVPLVLSNSAGVSFAGGAGNTFVTGSTAADSITTGIGNDTIVSNGGADVINSGAGNDTVTGGTGAEIINLGSGADTVTGGDGIDTIDLGAADAAADTVILSGILLNDNSDVISNFATTIDKVTIAAANTSVAGTAAPIVTLSTTAAANGGGAYTSSVATNAADIIRLTVTNTVANGNLAASTTGSELLKAISLNGTAHTGITANANSETGYLMATQNGTTYLYYFDEDVTSANALVAATEIQLVATFTGATLVAGDFTTMA
jgi:Ca2+-binding RTX toxin-like protein